MSRLSAVLFDLDGLLIDSEPVWFRVEQRVMASLGGPPWRHEDQARCVGGTLPRTAAYLLGLAGSSATAELRDGEVPDVEVPDAEASNPSVSDAGMVSRAGPNGEVPNAEVQRRLVTGMEAELRSGVPLRPGAAGLLTELVEARIPLALVSSSYRVLVDAALDGIGRSHFAVSVAGDEVSHPKPHPEPYLRAARLLGVQPASCVVFEDAPTGIAAAEAAGCLCVGVPDVVPISGTPTRPVLDSLAEVDLGWLLELPALLSGGGNAAEGRARPPDPPTTIRSGQSARFTRPTL